MNKKAIKIILLVLAGIAAVFVLWLIITTAFYAITHPTISLGVLDKPMDNNLVSAKQIGAYLNDEIQKIDKLGKYDLVIGSIDMKVNREHRGEVTVIFVEKDNKKPKVIFAYLDTDKGILNKFQDYGRESKLYPGIINLSDWKIDSVEAIKIAEEFFKDKEGFEYDEIWIQTYSDALVDYSGGEEEWLVFLTDNKKSIRYYTRIDPYSGEVVVHSIY